MESQIEKDGLIKVASKSPPDQSFLTRQLSDKLLRSPSPASVDLPPNFDEHPKVKELIARIKTLSNLAQEPKGQFTKEELDDPESVAIERMVPLRVGRWRMLPEGIENKPVEPESPPQESRTTGTQRTRDKWPNAVREVHLAGGLRALNNAMKADVEFLPLLDSTPRSFQIADYGDLLRNLRQDFRLKIIGYDLIDHQLQVDGHMPPMWLPFHEDLGGHLVMKTRTLWSDLGTGGLESDNLAFIDLCHRIKFQIDSSAWRLRDLSNAYCTELNALVETDGYHHGKRINTMNSFAIEIAVHSFLTDLATLRDYLAEFIAKYVLGPFRTDNKHIRLMAKLKSEILPHVQGKHEIVEYLEGITAEDGWLKVLSDYRDLAVHYSPLSSADYRAWVVMKTLGQPSGAQFPSISLSLPADPSATKRERSKFDSSASWKKWQRENFGDGNSQQGPDTLQYCHETLGRMTFLAWGVGGYSPIKPKRQVFNSSNSWDFRTTEYKPKSAK